MKHEPDKIEQTNDVISRNKRLRKVFFKTLGISLFVTGVLGATGILMYRSIVKPPDIPVYAMANETSETPPIYTPTPIAAATQTEDVAYHMPEAHEDDATAGGGLKAPEGFTSEDRKEQFYTFLIFGMDDGVNTDTIMVASYDGVQSEGHVISIPRDTKIDVKRSLKKINAAYGAGTQKGGHEGGVAQLKREIKTIIGFEPDFYICVNLRAFIEVVDAVGGVDVEVPLNMIYDDPYQNLHINIKKGLQHLDGANALKFARYRKGNASKTTISDYQRIENQQAVIKAVLEKLLKPANLLKIPAFIEIFQTNVKSDLSLENMLWFADQLNQVKNADALSSHTIPTLEEGSGPPLYYELLHGSAIVELVNETINPFKKEIKRSDLDIAK